MGDDGVEACSNCGNKLYRLEKGVGYLDFICSVCNTTFRVIMDEPEPPSKPWTGCAC